ncbi:hypothetical protein GQ44DRAFT_744153 [Phaeosphaeriaceae sp. PMI808]|nr:hypothetical protein GQ44DRAFT_744153 [Phaeosphaeriaceae sp. PMI808]
MCGRYVLALRPSEVRQQLELSQMPVQESPNDDQVRQSYNFAPGYHGLVYRADSPKDKVLREGATGDTQYKLQAMQWGLVPFWTKRNPDYGGKLKTINCRDDSLCQNGGMWTTMKKKRRCIVIAQGFYEWPKMGNQKVPHFTKRKDGQLMCFAGLWDVVQFEDSSEKLYTYSIITSASNKQLHFLHDRMPVILDNGSDAIRSWLDPSSTEWTQHLQSLLKPYHGELECYPVNNGVGKVGNNSPSFIAPINSPQNKNNIANFFGNQRKAKQDPKVKIEYDINETRATTDHMEGTADTVALPDTDCPATQTSKHLKSTKRGRCEADFDDDTADTKTPSKMHKFALSASPPKKTVALPSSIPAKKQCTRSATSNGSAAKTPKGGGSQKITSFFSNK